VFHSFRNMSDAEWDQIQAVHLKGAFSCTRAAWPIFRKQKFGRIVNTASAAGLYGNFGQANYSAAKMGLVAFTKTLAIEGEKYGIRATVIAPVISPFHCENSNGADCGLGSCFGHDRDDYATGHAC
jgi:multifunctional beta-oxidation protein